MIIFRMNLFFGQYLLVHLIKKKEKFRIEIANSIPNTGLVFDYGQTR